MEQYRLAVVGTGSGGRLSMKAAQASERFELVAAADFDPAARERAAADFPGVESFTDHASLLRACHADVVCVSSWAPSHAEVARAALATDLKGIVVEKPLAGRYREAVELLNEIETAGIPLAVPHGLLVSPHVKQILDVVQGGGIGELRLVEVQCTRWDIMNAGIHWLNFFVTLLGDDPVRSVCAQCDASTRTYRDGFQVETFGITYAESTDGVRLIMATGDDVDVSRQGKDTLFRIVGDEGTIEFWGWEPAFRIQNGDHKSGRSITVDAESRSRHQIHLENLAVQMDRDQPDYRIGRSSLAALEIVEAAYLSARHGCLVGLPLEGFTPPPATDWDPGEPYSGADGGRDGRRL